MKCSHCAADPEERQTNHIVNCQDSIIIIRYATSVVRLCTPYPWQKRIEQYVQMAKDALSELSVVNLSVVNYQDLSA